MSVLIPSMSFGPGRCGSVGSCVPVPAYHQDMAPLFSLLDDAFAGPQRAPSPPRHNNRKTHTNGSTKSLGNRHAQPATKTATPRQKEWLPRFDVNEGPDAFYIDAELPGVEPKDVAVEFLDEKTLSIKGKSERRNLSIPAPASVEEEQRSASTSASPAIPPSDNGSVKSFHQPTVEDEDSNNAPLASTESLEHLKQTLEAAEDHEKSSAAQEQEPEHTTTMTQSQPQYQYWVSERHVGAFQRQLAFPVRVDQDHIKASLKNGILSIIVPKAPAPGSRRIRIE